MTEIMQVLVLSTSHITKRDSDLLTESSWASDEYGHWVWAGYERQETAPLPQGMSKGFWGCMALARQHRCAYVRFDRDAEVNDSPLLSEFSW